MKNHFIIPYFGNKRMEVKNIYNVIKDRLETIQNIVEPFAGSSALSYYISTLHPKQYTYYINDIDNHLMELYNIMKDEKKTEDFLKQVNDILKDNFNKDKYIILKSNDNVVSWFIMHKVCSMRPGLYDLDYKYKKDIIFDAPIINFLRTENVILTCKDSIKIYNEHEDNKQSFIFLDPPYMQACNNFYTEERNFNIYEYIAHNNFKNKSAYIIFCLENNWIIQLIFKDYQNKILYDKLYQASKKKTTHIIISN